VYAIFIIYTQNMYCIHNVPLVSATTHG